MNMPSNKIKWTTIFESLVWVAIIVATIFIVAKYSWYDAFNNLQYVLLAGAIAAVYFYLKSQRLYRESEEKTKELFEKQREVKSRQKTINLIFDNSADGILILDDEQRIEAFSPGMERITGYNKQEAVGRIAQQFLKFRGEKDSSLLPDLMFVSNKLKKEDPYIKNSLISKDGKVVDIEASFTMIKEPGEKIRSLAIIRDVSYEKALTERDKEFIAVTSHQLNTPLSIVKGYSSLLLDGKVGELTDKQKEHIEEIKKASDRMVLLTNNLLSISRIEQDKIKLSLSDINVLDLIANIEKSFQEKLLDSKIKLSINENKIDKNLIISGDEEKLNQAISNVVDNAIKYTKEGSISLSVENMESKVLIRVKDTGIGIGKDDLEKIGEKFYRAQNAIDIDNQGTGLGVFISKVIVEKHGGELKIESTIGKGTEVEITLPKHQNKSDIVPITAQI